MKITEALVDNAENAVIRNTSLATILDDATAITVTGYPVTLPDGFSGEDIAKPGEDYTFTPPDDYYGAWVYLVISDTDFDAAAASQRIATASGSRTGVVYAGSDVTDAKLAYDLYRAQYDNFETVSMMKFLGADVNADRKIDVRDAASIVHKEG